MSSRPAPRRLPRLLVLAVLALAPVGSARADWLYPDPSYREAQQALRAALRDTAGHPDDPARIDTLATALLRLGRFADAGRLFQRTLELVPGDGQACAGLGKLALFEDRLADAESLLARARQQGLEESAADLYAARYRAGHYAAAAALAAELPGLQAREGKLRALAEEGAYRVTWDGTEVTLRFTRTYPVPLVRVEVNGKPALMAIDMGAGETLLDPTAARRLEVRAFPGTTPVFWSGQRVPAGEGIARRIQLGPAAVEQVPVQVASLRSYSLTVNPQAPMIDGVIGVGLLRCFSPTLDYRRGRLELRRAPAPAGAQAHHVPLQIWGSHELTVWGSLNQGRPMALVVATGLPECGVASSPLVFDELGLKPTTLSRLLNQPGRFLGGRRWAQVVVPLVQVGTASASRVPGWSGALDDRELWWHGVRRDGLLSSDFLRAYRVTFDWARRELVLDPRR